MKKVLALTSLAIILTACGGGSDDSPEQPAPEQPTPTPPTVLTGVLIDSPVINIDYTTDSQNILQTNANGEFTYIEGEQVQFSIGDLNFPLVDGKSILTPRDLASSPNTNNQAVINMLRLLQTLDKDGNPENGIEITDQAKSNATTVDFDIPTDDFAELSTINTLITDAGQDNQVTGLVSEANAIAHFEKQLIVNGIETSRTPFTSDEINSFTFYLAVRDESCPNPSFYYTETFNFSNGSYSLRLCNGTLETGQYSEPEAGIFELTAFGEYIARYSKNDDTNSFVGCYAKSLNEVNNCADENVFIGFTDAMQAAAYTANLNKEISDGIAFTESELGNFTFYFVLTDDDCPEPTRYYVESINLSNGSYTLNDCNNLIETSDYTLLDNGIVQRNDTNETIKRLDIEIGQDKFMGCYSYSGDTSSQTCAEGDEQFVGYLNEDEAQAEAERLNDNLPMGLDMRLFNATSTIENSNCPGVLAGWTYTFTETEMQLQGTDGWNNCVLVEEESFSLNMAELDSDYDIPFNCENYPICVEDDFNKTINGVDEDEREYTSTYSYNGANKQLTYIKRVEETTFTEIITIVEKD